jgi:phosphatidylglycerophosphate synthase
MKSLAPFIVMIALLIIIAVIIIALLNYRLKMRMLETAQIDDRLLASLTKPGNKYEALKWGLILFFGGCGLIVIEFLPFEAEQSSLPYGVEIVFLSAGFLSYYLFVQNKTQK